MKSGPGTMQARAATPLEERATPSRWRSLPEDLLAQSCKRVGVAALVFASLWLVGIVMNNLVQPLLMRTTPSSWDPIWDRVGLPISIAGIVTSIAMVVAARVLHARVHLLLNVGLVYQILTGLLIAILFSVRPQIPRDGVSWLCLVIVVYPAIVPTSLLKTLIASLIVASMDPLALWLAHLRGVAFDHDLFHLLWYVLPNYLSVGLAVIPASVIGSLGRQVSKARELGSYHIGERIGRGGMGEVYRASHRMLARPAAIKLIRPEILSRGDAAAARVLVQRFRREARAAASLKSPHTIDLYDFGETQDGTFYYVMELLEGVDFETLVTRFGPVPSGRVSFLLRHVCHSLGEAHARGLVHRDIKPSNIFTCRLGLNVDFVKVLDFGLVKHRMGGGPEQSLLTSPDVTTGTPAFIAPEVALGEAIVTESADIYSLGCVGYWLLTGHLVFDADSPVKMMVQHIQAEPVAPSRRSEIEIPGSLEAIILSCLAKKPEDRPTGTAALANALAACEDLSPWTKELAEQWWETHLPGEAPRSILREETPMATIQIART